MYRTLLIFWRTYWGNLTRVSYLFFTFGLPLMLLAVPVLVGGIAAVVIRSALPPTDERPIGVVDATPEGDFSDVESFGDDPAPMQLFGGETAAQNAMTAGEIQSYYVFPADYWETGTITADYNVPPNIQVQGRIEDWIRDRQQEDVSREILLRYYAGADILHADVTGEEAFADDSYFEWGLLFALIYISRIVGMFTSGYMYNSIASEARNRTMEILLTSVSAAQFVTGKLLGLIAVGLTQLTIWASLPVAFIVVVSAVSGNNLTRFIFEWEYLGLVISFLLGAYFLDQIMAAATGILRVSGGAGPQLFNLIGWATTLALLYAAYYVPRDPNSTLAVVTSMIPITSPIVMLTRAVAGEVPTWQLVLSQAILWGTCVAAVFGLTKLLRLNLVANAPSFDLWKWIKRRGGQVRRSVAG